MISGIVVVTLVAVLICETHADNIKYYNFYTMSVCLYQTDVLGPEYTIFAGQTGETE